MILGIHASVRRGFSAALEEAESLGCAAMQMLPYPRHQEPSPESLAQFRAARERGCVRRLLIHSRFVPSLASAEESRRARSVSHLEKELRLAEALGGEAYVLHAGAYSPDSDKTEGIRLFVDSVGLAWRRSGAKVPILLENVPGGGRRLGGSLEELAELLAGVSRWVPGAGVCLDSAHAFAAGHDISTAEGVLKFLARVNRLIGAEMVRAFHLNDTRAHLGTHLESHEHWGQGRLRAECLGAFLGRTEYADTPAILETPKEEGADRRNLDFAKELARQG